MSGPQIVQLVDSTGSPVDGSTSSYLATQLTGSKPKLITSGTINVGIGATNPVTGNINEPSTIYRKFILAYHNVTGQTLNGVTVYGNNATIGGWTGGDIEVNGKNVTYGSTGNAGLVEFFCDYTDPYLFMFGTSILIQFNLSAATTVASNLDWALYGSN